MRKYQDHLFDDCGWWLVVGGWACAVCGGGVCHSAAIIYFLLECNQWPGTVKRGRRWCTWKVYKLGSTMHTRTTMQKEQHASVTPGTGRIVPLLYYQKNSPGNRTQAHHNFGAFRNTCEKSLTFNIAS